MQSIMTRLKLLLAALVIAVPALAQAQIDPSWQITGVSGTPTGSGALVLRTSPSLIGLTMGGNVGLGANYLSYGGTAAGLSFDSGNNATFSAGISGTTGAFSGLLTANAGLSIPTGQSIVGAGTAAISMAGTGAIGGLLTLGTQNISVGKVVFSTPDSNSSGRPFGFTAQDGTYGTFALKIASAAGGDPIAGTAVTTWTSTGLAVTGTTSSTAFSGPLTGNVTGNVSGSSGSTTGNAATATTATNFNNGTSSSSGGTVTATTFSGALSGNASTATTAGTVTTAAQPNITSVGTLTSVTSSGAISGTTGAFTGNVKTNNYFNFTGANAGLSFTGSDGGVFSNGLAVTGATSSTTFKDSGGHLLISSTAPAIASGFGTGSACTICNNTAAFMITTNATGAATTGVVTLPTASGLWACRVTTTAWPTAEVEVTSRSSTSVTVTNITRLTGVTLAFGGEQLQFQCTAM